MRVSIVHRLEPYKDFRCTARARNPRAAWGVRSDRPGYSIEVVSRDYLEELTNPAPRGGVYLLNVQVEFIAASCGG